MWGGADAPLKERLETALTGKSKASATGGALRPTQAMIIHFCEIVQILEEFGAGSDESGKGDFFGPLVVAAVLVDIATAEKLVSLGVKDCKMINDKEVLRLATLITEVAPVNTVLALKPEMYNYRYRQLRAEGKNLNHLLSSGHVAVLRNVLRQCHQCNYALVDQFTVSNDIRSSVQQEFPAVNVVQQHRAEADIAVAARRYWHGLSF